MKGSLWSYTYWVILCCGVVAVLARDVRTDKAVGVLLDMCVLCVFALIAYSDRPRKD